MMHTDFHRTLFLFLATFGVVALPQSDVVYAEAEPYQSVEVKLSWGDVPGNQGYVLQVQGRDGKLVNEIQVQETRATIQLPPGDYQVRLAALNKFRRPSVWTPWKDFTISGEEKTQSIQAEEKLAPPGPFDYENFIPGMKRIQFGFSSDTWHHHAIGGGWIAGMAGSLLYFQSEKTAGNSIARNSLNDPEFLGIALYGADINMMLLASLRRGQERSDYKQHQSNQKVALELFSILYIAQYIDAVLLEAPEEGADSGGWETDLALSFAPPLPESGYRRPEAEAQFRFTFRY